MSFLLFGRKKKEKEAEKEPLYYDLINCDTTSNCNIRCRFCFNNWEKIPPNYNMPEETFRKMISLLPLVRRESFFISCLYEPFLNKNFFNYVQMIPVTQKEKVFFTTNLVTRLSDDQILALSKAHVNHINISLESLNADTYQKLIDHGNFDNFSDNLKRLTEVFKKTPDAPKLRFITMIMRDNMEELPEIVQRCHEEFGSQIHELRTPYVGPEMRLSWLDNQILTREELVALEEKIRNLNLPYAMMTDTDTDSYQKIIDGKRTMTEEQKAEKEAAERKFQLKIDSHGIVSSYGTREEIDINELEDPYAVFKEKLEMLRAEK